MRRQHARPPSPLPASYLYTRPCASSLLSLDEVIDYAMEQSQLQKWEGSACVKLPSVKADQAWSLLSSYCSLHLWLPSIEICRKVAGDDDRPGCVRFCGGPEGCGKEPEFWVNEELLAYDQADRSYRYEVTDNNMGLGWYVATLRVMSEEPEAAAAEEEEEEEKEGGGGCRIEWSFDADPVEGWTREGLVANLELGLEAMAKKVEEALQAQPPRKE